MERLIDPTLIHEEKLKLFREIAYVGNDGTILPMDIVLTTLRVENSEKVKNSEILFLSLKNFLKSSQGNTREKLLEAHTLTPTLAEYHARLLEKQELPLFARWDSSVLNPLTDKSVLPPAIEIQFRIGGLGFHTAIDECLLGRSFLPETTAKTLRGVSESRWKENTPKVSLLVPEQKSREVFFWAEKLKQNGIDAKVLLIDNLKETVHQILVSVESGTRIIIRREFHLPMLGENWEDGKKLLEMNLAGEILFEPPLPLLFDGKAILPMISQAKNQTKNSEVLKESVAPTTVVDNFELAEHLVKDFRKGVLKLGSGYDLERSFGGRSVFFLRDLSKAQGEAALNLIKADIWQGLFWIWQPDLNIKKEKVETLSHQTKKTKMVEGNVRTMFFVNLDSCKLVSGGFNINAGSKIVRGGNAVGTIFTGFPL